MARRFIVKEEDIIEVDLDKNIFHIKGSEAKHINVLRHKKGDFVIINEYICKIIDILKENITLTIIQKNIKIGEPTFSLTLYIALLKNDKLDFLVQKAVELGVKKIVIFSCKNVVVKLDEKGMIKRKNKLQIIANEACKQCGRTDLVEVLDIITFKELIKKLDVFDTCIFAYEKETASLKESLNNITNMENIACIIGPEGGFDIIEKDQLIELENVKSVSLGSRILRAETAALNLISIIMYEKEE